MTVAISAACVSLIGGIMIFLLNQRSQITLERRQAQINRIGNQLRLLYGPLCVLVDVNEAIWEKLRESQLPDQATRRSGTPLPQAEHERWKSWRNIAFMPANMRMRDLIIEHADLIIGPSLPSPLRIFCAHVTASEVLISGESDASRVVQGALIGHPGKSYVEYVRQSFADLKAEQARLLRLSAPRH